MVLSPMAQLAKHDEQRTSFFHDLVDVFLHGWTFSCAKGVPSKTDLHKKRLLMTDDKMNQVRHYLCGKNAFLGLLHPLAHQFNNGLDALLKYEEDLLPFLALCQKNTLNMNTSAVLPPKKRQLLLPMQVFCYSALNKSLMPPMLPSRLVAS